MRVGRPMLDREKPPYALPTMLTAGTLFCGYFCLMKTVQAISLPPEAAAQAARFYDHAAMAIGIAVLTDGLDGRVARATGATSEFGREIDSLADAITFGVAPATLAFAWGIRSPELQTGLWLGAYLPGLGYLLAFLFMLCGAARLARFNVQKNPQPKNPGRPGKRYFVGMPIPASAGMLAAVVHARSGVPIENWWPNGALWLGAHRAALVLDGFELALLQLQGLEPDAHSWPRYRCHRRADLLDLEFLARRAARHRDHILAQRHLLAAGLAIQARQVRRNARAGRER